MKVEKCVENEKSVESTSKVEKLLIGETSCEGWKKALKAETLSKVEKTVESWNKRTKLTKAFKV